MLLFSKMVLIFVVVVISIVSLIFVLLTNTDFSISQPLSEEEIREFLEKGADEPYRYFLEQELIGEAKDKEGVIVGNIEFRGRQVLIKKKYYGVIYKKFEKPEVLEEFSYSSRNEDFLCKKEGDEWKCERVFYISLEPQDIRSISSALGFRLGDIEELFTKNAKIIAYRKKCFQYNCTCMDIDAKEVLAKGFRKSFGITEKELKVNKARFYVCQEEKSKITLELEVDIDMDVSIGDNKFTRMNIFGKISTINFKKEYSPADLMFGGPSDILEKARDFLLKCDSDRECSRACSELCPEDVYGCCYGCRIGKCINGECKCVEDRSYCRYASYQVGPKCVSE